MGKIVGYLIHRTTQRLLNSIHRKLKSSTFVPLVEKSVPLHLWPPRSVHWVCPPRRLVRHCQSHPRLERLEDHCPAYDPESSSHRLHRPMRFRSQSRFLAGTVIEILGTCMSVGCTIDGRHPREITDDVNSGALEVPEE